MNPKTKKTLEDIFSAGLKAADPEQAVKGHVRLNGNLLRVGERSYDLDSYDNIIVTGFGKATAPMAKALEDILGDRLTDGLITVKFGHGLPLKKVVVKTAGHPAPDEAGIRSTRLILERLAKCTEKDLVLCAFSGGGSALSPAPRPPLGLEDKQKTTRILLECGASIFELNAIRKHLSICKGGQLARLAHPATLVALFLSDVVGDPLDVISSGPTVPDPSTYSDCLEIVERYGLPASVPEKVLKLFRDGADGRIEETPKQGDAAFEKVQNLVVGNNRASLLASAQRAKRLGYNTLILTSFLQGEAREVAQALAAIAKEIVTTGNPAPAPACILAGGETTVTIRGNGKGGRNQELALAAATSIAGWPQIALLSAGTDGTDGPSDAAGAFADGSTCRNAALMGLIPRNYLERNDSYHFFEALGDLFITGPTRTNVMDVVCILVDRG
ncbi:MAG TPA: glycerate kinase [Syntrophobacteraceae bacterium]|nr:glycerate kinase [Syntrophobacteraceae bacterium]